MKGINLNNTSKLGIGLLAALLLLGLAGSADRVEQIIYNMPDTTYQEIKSKLTVDGDTPSDRTIADFYIKHYKANN